MWLRWLFRCSLNSTVLPFEDCSVTNPSLSGEPSPMSNLNLPFLMNLAGSFNSCFMSYCWSLQHLPLPAPPRGMTRCNETTLPTPPGWIRQVTSDLSQSLWLSCEHMISLMLLYWGAQNCTQDSRWGHRNALQGGTITHVDWQAVLFLMLQSCSACHQPQPQISLLYSLFSPALCVLARLPYPGWRMQHFLINFIQLVCTQLSRLSRFPNKPLYIWRSP